MIALVQRVLEASVSIDGVETARIGGGLLALIGVERSDAEADATRLAARLCRFRMFADTEGRMNLDVVQAGGGALLVPQFTLAADTSRGRRPGFSGAAPPELARHLFDVLHTAVADAVAQSRTGTFGAHMHVASINDGPVTFWLRSADPPRGADTADVARSV